ncbi:hypothetical protein ACFBZI_05540 [Moraxella sp. ZJ142]
MWLNGLTPRLLRHQTAADLFGKLIGEGFLDAGQAETVGTP